MTNQHDLIERLNTAIATAINDDETKPHTPLKDRHLQRVFAMQDARDALDLGAAQDWAERLRLLCDDLEEWQRVGKKALSEASEAYETGRQEERAKCLADIDYIRENIRNQQTPDGRKRFDIYDLDRVLRNTCTLIRERITGEDEGKWRRLDGESTEESR